MMECAQFSELIPVQKFSGVFNSFAKAKLEILAFAKENGFGLRQSRNGPGDKKRYPFKCTMEGRTCASEAPEYRKNMPYRCGCRYAISLMKIITIIDCSSTLRHNHGHREIGNTPIFKKMPVDLQRRVTGQLLHSAPLHIRASLGDSGNVVKPRDVYNLAQRNRANFLEGKSPLNYVLNSIFPGNFVVKKLVESCLPSS